jgi:hypothetical protein
VTSQPSDTPTPAPTGPAGTPAGPTPTGPADRSARDFTEPLRQPAAAALLVANGLVLLFAVIDMFVIFEDWPGNFLARAGASFVDFVGLVSIGFPLLAVLLATHVKPRLPQARLITIVALVEYGVSALFGALCLLVDFLHGVTGTHTILGMSPARRAFEDFLIRAAEYTLLALAALAVFQLFRGLYAATRPAGADQSYGGGYPYAYGQQGYQYGEPPTYAPGFHPYGQQATGYAGQSSAWAAPTGAQPAYGTQPPAPQGHVPPTRPEPQGAPDPSAAAGDGQPGPATQPPADADGPGQQWQRP